MHSYRSPWTQALPLLPQKTPPAERDIKAREQLNYELDLISSEAEVQKKHGPKVSNLSRYKEFCYHKWSRKVWSTDHIATMCAISAGGSTFAILDGDNKIRIINRRIASQYCTIDIRTEKPSEYDVKVTRLTLSDTGDRLGVEMNRFQWTNSQDGVLYETFQIWDVGSQKLHRTFEAAGKSAFAVPTASFTFSPDGRSFVAYKEGIRICLSPMDSSLPAPIFLPLPPYADQLPCTIAFWDNMRIICWLEQMSGTLFDLQDLKLVGKNVAGNIIARGQAQNSRFHVFSYNLSILAYLTLKTSQRPYESLDIFSMLEGTTWTSILIPEQLRSHLSDVTLRISYGASDYLAAMFDNNEIRVWDINEGVEVASFPSDPSIRRMWIGFTLGHRLLVGGSPGPGSLVSVVDDFEYFVDDMGLFIRKNSRTEKKFPSSKLTTD
jgi:WD40 repeat protein